LAGISTPPPPQIKREDASTKQRSWQSLTHSARSREKGTLFMRPVAQVEMQKRCMITFGERRWRDR
jgi:hypothetical protein